MRVEVICEQCGHVNVVEVQPPRLPMSEPVEDAPLRGPKGPRKLPLSEPLEDDENGDVPG